MDVSRDADFQRKYNSFYRVRQRSARWYEEYFSSMQGWKGLKPSFDEVIDHLRKSLGRYEPSFSSKLVATLDPEQPVWDFHVLANINHSPPSYSSKNKFDQAKMTYRLIQSWYNGLLRSEEGKLLISVFDEMVPEHAEITDLKKADFVLWQTRKSKVPGTVS